MSNTVFLPSRLSWSAVSSYAECGERYRLERMYKVRNSTWYSSIAGNAVHEIVEAIERAVLVGFDLDAAAAMAPAFKGKFDELIAEEPEGTEILASGKLAKSLTEYGGPNKKNYDWWLHFGPIYVERYVRWRKAHDWQVAILPGGKPGIELDWETVLGGEPVVGYVDLLMYDPQADAFIIIDVKSGKEPGGPLQLLTYYAGLKATYGLDIPFAGFWLPSPRRGVEPGSAEDYGRTSELVRTSRYSLDQIDNMYRSAMRGIRSGIFIPTQSERCRGCTVAEFCWVTDGAKKKQIPIFDEIVDRPSGEVVFAGSSGKFDHERGASVADGPAEAKGKGTANE